MKNIFFAVILVIAGAFFSVSASAQESRPKTVIYFFWGDGCPHCAHEKPFLQTLTQKYPEIEIRSYEVWRNPGNKDLYKRLADAYGIPGGNVPATFIGETAWLGYNDTKAREMEIKLKYCHKYGCPDPNGVKKVMAGAQGSAMTLPFFGEVETAKMSLPVLTVIIGGLDSFNPCAFFVLFMLLSLLVYAKSRARILLVGGIFVFASGFIYFLFMVAWLNLFLVMGRVDTLTLVAGIISVGIALINIKEYFFFGEGVSLTIPESAKPALFERMRNILKAGSILVVVSGTVVLAVAANTYELLCTAGFPMVFTRILTLHKLPAFEYYLYLVFYNVIYVIPLVVIVLVFTFTLGSRKLTEDEGRILKLVSGLMMFGLGGVLIIKPALLNNVFASLGLIVGALLISGTIIVWRQKTHPAPKKGVGVS